jgi:hypothetical protein
MLNKSQQGKGHPDGVLKHGFRVIAVRFGERWNPSHEERKIKFAPNSSFDMVERRPRLMAVYVSVPFTTPRFTQPSVL